MTTVRAELTADKAVLRRDEFDQLIALARRTEPVEVVAEQEAGEPNMARLAKEGCAFDFWKEAGESIFFEDHTLSQLASSQNAKPLDENTVLPKVFAEDESVDRFLEAIYQSRR